MKRFKAMDFSLMAYFVMENGNDKKRKSKIECDCKIF